MSYRLLETLRAYGRARLDPEETAGLERAHARYYVAFAEEAGAGVRGPDEPGGVLRIERSFPNLREAHQWAVRHQDADVALRLPAALFRYGLWRLRDEVFRWAEAALEVEGAADHPQWPTVCGVAGWGCGLRGQRLRAARLAEQGLAAARPDDPGRVALAEAEGHIALWEGRLDECIAIMDRAAEFAAGSDELIPWTVRALALAYDERIDEAVTMARYAQAAADRLANPTMMALARYCLAEALLDRDPDQAAALLDHATELAGRVRNRMLLGVAGVSATALRARHGDTATALRSSAAVLDLWSQTSDWTHMWVGMRSLAELFARVGADRAAAVLLGAVRGADTAPPVFGADADRLADLEAALAQRLGDRELAGARSQGQTMGAADVLTFARAEIEQTVAPAG